MAVQLQATYRYDFKKINEIVQNISIKQKYKTSRVERGMLKMECVKNNPNHIIMCTTPQVQLKGNRKET